MNICDTFGFSIILSPIYSRSQKNVSNFVPFRSLLKRRSFTVGIRSILFRLESLPYMRSREGHHSWDVKASLWKYISSSTCVGTTFSLLRVCARKNLVSFPVSESLPRLRGVCYTEFTTERNWTETERNDSERQTERNGMKLQSFLTPTVYDNGHHDIITFCSFYIQGQLLLKTYTLYTYICITS